MWHDKDPSILLKGRERRASVQILQPFTGNGDVAIKVNNSGAGRKTNKTYRHVVSRCQHGLSKNL
jgi:hypothetical protein